MLNTPLILIFSLFFFAVLLNQKFHGRVLARAIFFSCRLFWPRALLPALRTAI
ncbi:hypothetical protein ACFSQ7_47570 [Paenibacillus rhizoplanae]